MQPITTILLGLVLGPTSLLALQCYQTTAASLTDIQVSQFRRISFIINMTSYDHSKVAHALKGVAN